MKAEHGGDLHRAINSFGGHRSQWIDMSTGINPHSYPLPRMDTGLWTALPDLHLRQAADAAAAVAYQTTQAILSVAGAQQAIQHYPALFAKQTAGRQARLIHPSYNEHENQLIQQSWQVQRVREIKQLAGADIAVVVNPNNPNGQYTQPEKLLSLSNKVGFLVIDESFCDSLPHLSVCPHLSSQHDNVLVLRSFGKFYGLAGMRLGFVIGAKDHLDNLDKMIGSWAVSGPALAVGQAALLDHSWAKKTTSRLTTEAKQLDNLVLQAGWKIVGGTSLFRLYQMPNAVDWQDQLARHRIWTRTFSYNDTWLRIGLPPKCGWSRLKKALDL